MYNAPIISVMLFIIITEFSLSNILGELKDLTPKMYMQLSLELGLDKNIYDRFSLTYPTDFDRVLTEVLDWWMKNKSDPKPSWQELRRALSVLQARYSWAIMLR